MNRYAHGADSNHLPRKVHKLGSKVYHFVAVAVLVGTLSPPNAYAVERYRLDNGLTVVLAPNRLAPVVAMQAWVGVGSADETRSQAGIAHVFEHMLFKGTARRGVGEIARAVEAAGGDINAWTAFDQTVYHVVLASRYFDTGLDVLSDALSSSSFDRGELEREREVILEEIKQGHDDPSRTMAQGLFSTAFVRHPYRRPVIGNESSVRSFRRRDLMDFFREWYVANNVTLVVAGDFDHRRARRNIDSYFGRLKKGSLARKARKEPRQREPRAIVVTRDVSEVNLAIGFHAPPLRDEDTAALDVLAIILGQGESSRLSTRVRRRSELVTSVYSYVHSLRDAGLFIIGASCPLENLDPATEAITNECFALAHRPVSAAELGKAIHAVQADSIYQRETVEGMARKLGYYEATAADAEYEEEYVRAIARVTSDDVVRVARDYLTADRANISAVVPRRPRKDNDRSRAAQGNRMVKMVARAARLSAKNLGGAKKTSGTKSDLTRDTLPNGLRIVVKRDKSVPIVSARAVWTGGLRAETTANNGVNNLLAATITRGCGDHTAEDIIREVDEMAASLAGFSGRNSFGLRAEWLAKNWEQGFDLMAECILAPSFDNEELAREQRRVLDDLRSREDSPSYGAFRLFVETLYRNHPYRLDTLGTSESIRTLSRSKIANYYKRNYPLSDMTLAVVGDVDPARVVARAKARFGSAKKVKRAAIKVPSQPFDLRKGTEREVYRYLDREQAHMVVGFPGTTVGDSDRFALEVLTSVLGGQGGRLFLELRDKQALAYRVGAFSLEGVDPGYIAVYIACSPEKIPQALTEIRTQLDRIVADGVTKREVDRAVKYLVGTHEISLQRRASLASALAFYEAYGLGYDEYQRYAKTITSIKASDVKRVASKYFDWDKAVTATVTRKTQSPEVARRERGTKKRPPRSRAKSKAPSKKSGKRRR
jgi:zinc protease